MISKSFNVGSPYPPLIPPWSPPVGGETDVDVGWALPTTTSIAAVTSSL